MFIQLLPSHWALGIRQGRSSHHLSLHHRHGRHGHHESTSWVPFFGGGQTTVKKRLRVGRQDVNSSGGAGGCSRLILGPFILLKCQHADTHKFHLHFITSEKRFLDAIPRFALDTTMWGLRSLPEASPLGGKSSCLQKD